MKNCLSALYSACFLLFPLAIYSQQWDLRGQLTSSTNLHNDPIDGITEIDQRVGYIPTLSIYPDHKFLNNIDFEAAFNLQANFEGLFGADEGNNYHDRDIHRLWARYSTENIELRYGIQKIAFGPGLILRPLRWFDSLDEKDPTGQTEGVTAVRIKYFGGKGITYWGWLIHPEDRDISSRGGRIEIPIAGLGDLGASYHHRPAYLNGITPKRSGNWFGFPNAGEDRYGIDIRTDAIIGLWAEGVISNSFSHNILYKSKSRVYMAGGDYTFPVGNGLYFLTEQMIYNFEYIFIGEELEGKISTVMLTYPLGMLDQLYYIAEYDWEDKLSLNFLRFSRTYDNYSFNIMAIANQVKDRHIGIGGRIESSIKQQKTMQFMIIYNH